MSITEIIAKIPHAFEAARDSADLLFFPSTVTIHSESGVEYEIRLCSALKDKPINPTKSAQVPGGVDAVGGNAKLDPFAPPYNLALFVGEVKNSEEDGDEYVVLLNKYSVVPNHFLLITKEYQPQTSPLTPPDLLTAYQFLVAAKNSGNPLLAFFNCGESSGASQPHKHIQFLPIEGNGPPMERVAREATIETPGKPFTLNKVPYANHVFRFPPYLATAGNDKIEETLASAFIQLLDLVVSTIRHSPEYPAGNPSYNVLLTLEHMHLIPRARDVYPLPWGNLPVNSLGFAGMLLAKSDEEVTSIKLEGIGKILRGVGLESVHEIQVAEAQTEAEDVGALQGQGLSKY